MIDWRAAYTWGCADLTTPSPGNSKYGEGTVIEIRYVYDLNRVFLMLQTDLNGAISLRRVLNFIVYGMQDGSLENVKTHLTGLERG